MLASQDLARFVRLVDPDLPSIHAKPSSRGPASAIVMRSQEIESSVGAAQEASNEEGHARYMHVYDLHVSDLDAINE